MDIIFNQVTLAALVLGGVSLMGAWLASRAYDWKWHHRAPGE